MIDRQCKVLLVDDERDICDIISMILEQMQVITAVAMSVSEAKTRLQEEQFDFCLTDFKLGDGDGFDLLEWVQKNHPHMPVAIFTAYGSVDLATSALKKGAYDFVTKPLNVQTVRRLVENALNSVQFSLKSKQGSQYAIIGTSSGMKTILNLVDKVARSQAPVLIVGPPGSGKELIARRIHESSPRRKGPFTAVNCSAIAADSMESEFFGVKQFEPTEAMTDRKGLFQLAQGGTLFLDEISELPLPMQVKLLRVIQEKTVRAMGGTQDEMLDIRVISATHHDLGARVREKLFREDLFYRLHVIELNVPGLSERKEDIPLLVEYLLEKICRQWGRPAVTVEATALTALQAYPFPGNVRELENILERALTLCESETLTEKDLYLPSIFSTEETAGLFNVVNMAAKQTIASVLARCQGNKARAAAELGISVRALRYQLKKLNPQDPEDEI